MTWLTAWSFIKQYKWIFIVVCVVGFYQIRLSILQHSLDKATQEKTACESRESLRESASEQKSKQWKLNEENLQDKRVIDLGKIKARTND